MPPTIAKKPATESAATARPQMTPKGDPLHQPPRPKPTPALMTFTTTEPRGTPKRVQPACQTKSAEDVQREAVDAVAAVRLAYEDAIMRMLKGETVDQLELGRLALAAGLGDSQDRKRAIDRVEGLLRQITEAGTNAEFRCTTNELAAAETVLRDAIDERDKAIREFNQRVAAAQAPVDALRPRVDKMRVMRVNLADWKRFPEWLQNVVRNRMKKLRDVPGMRELQAVRERVRRIDTILAFDRNETLKRNYIDEVEGPNQFDGLVKEHQYAEFWHKHAARLNTERSETMRSIERMESELREIETRLQAEIDAAVNTYVSLIPEN
jgi:hypothetical protein